MKDRVLQTGIAGLSALLLMVLAGAFPVDHDGQLVIFRTPLFFALVLLIDLLLLISCFRRRPRVRQIAFFLSHAGLVVITAGAFCSWLAGERLDKVRLPVAMGHAAERLHAPSGREVDLGFSIEILNFSVTYYDPVYSLFRSRVPHPATEADYQFVQKVDPRSASTLRETPAGPIDPAVLKDGTNWISRLEQPGGWVLQKQPAVPSRFDASIRITNRGESSIYRLAVNHPLCVNGWRILLVSYGSTPVPYVELAFSRDPGRIWIISGIWCVLAGVSVLCLYMPKKKGPHADT